MGACLSSRPGHFMLVCCAVCGRASGPDGGVAGGLAWLVGQVAGLTVLVRGREDRGTGWVASPVRPGCGRLRGSPRYLAAAPNLPPGSVISLPVITNGRRGMHCT
jgi:hypothetical protein